MRRFVAFVLLILSSFLMCSCRRSVATASRTLSPVQVADRARLATISVVGEYEATVELADLHIDENALKSACAKRQGGLGGSRDEAMAAILSILFDDPARFISANGKSRTSKGKTTSLGSGFVVTPDGYVATNAHVVEPDKDDIKTALIASIVNLIDAEVKQFERAMADLLPGRGEISEISEDAKVRLQKFLTGRYAASARFVEMDRKVFAILGYTGSGDEIEIKREPCKVIKVGKAVPGKDVAICKMDGTDFPTLPLAASLEDAAVRTGAALFVVGYPGALALDNSFSAKSRLEPSMSSGHVSGIKDTTEGWRAIQTDASISPGNSGGPALNDGGEVVGLATFTVMGERTQNLNFVVSSEVVQEFFKDLQVAPSQSAFTAKFEEAMSAFERNDRKRALALFRALNAERPESSVVRDYVRKLNGQPATALVGQGTPSASPARSNPEPAPARHSESTPKLLLVTVCVILALIVVVAILANKR